MFKPNLIPVWIGIILLSGMFLMGQESWAPKCGPFYPDPCLSIPNAVPDSCGGAGRSDFTCECNAGYFWEEIGDTCEDPCALDPCGAIDNTVASSCTGISSDDFTCECNEGFYWSDATNTCEKVEPPCGPDPCQGVPNGIPGTCEPIPGGACAPATDFTCACDAGFAWDEVSNTCEAVGVPQFAGGTYEMRMTDIVQNPAACMMGGGTQLLIRQFASGITLGLDLPSGESILALQELGSPYPLTIDLPSPLTDVDVLLSLDPTRQDILMDGPDVYIADTTGVLPFAGVDCVITGSADGIFDDINTEPLTGSLTIDVTDVQASPGGACNLLYAPAGDCQLILTINAGSPL